MKLFLFIAAWLGSWVWFIEWLVPAVPGQFEACLGAAVRFVHRLQGRSSRM